MRFFLSLTCGLLFLAIQGWAQPLPCPPIVTTTVSIVPFDTTICRGACATLKTITATSIKSTDTYAVSSIPYLPTSYTGGTPVLVGFDDIYSAAIPIPFDFCFFGTKYDQCVIGANGEISFNISNANGSCPWSISGPIPGDNNVATINSIMGAYYDIDPQLGGTISYATYGTAPCRTFVVSWDNVPLFDLGFCPGLFGTQQIVLYESTYAIDIFLQQKPLCPSWNGGLAMLGIEDATGTQYYFAPGRNGTQWSATNEGWRFTPSGTPHSKFYWYDQAGTLIGTDSTVTVCPQDTSTYSIRWVPYTNCDSFPVTNMATVNVGNNPTIESFSFTNPNRCDSCNGTITLHGLKPFTSDTITYTYNNVAQPPVIIVADVDSNIELTHLCVGTYDNIVVKIDACLSNPAGPIVLTMANQAVNSMTFSNPSYCGNCDGTITLQGGLFTGLTDTLTYTFQDVNGNVTQHTLYYIIGPDSAITMANLCAGSYYNIIIGSGMCKTPAYGPITLVDPALNITEILGTNPTACGVCNGTIQLVGLPPNQFDTVRYTLNGVKQPYFIFPVSLDKTITMVNLCPGIYDSFVVSNATLSHCISNMEGPVTLVSPVITPGFTFNIHRGCPRDTVYFTNTATPADMEVRWRFGNGVTDTLPNPVYVYDTQGVYTVTQIVSNLTCTDSISQTVDVTHPIKAAFTVSPDTLCQGGTVTFTNNSIGGTPVYYWSFGDGSKIDSIDLSPAHTYFNPGIYHALLLERDAIPCTDTAGIDINVDPVSGISISQTDTALCAGQAITFRADYNKTGNTGYTWNFGDGNSVANESPVIHTYDVAGMYTVSVAATYRACPDAAGRVTVDVHPYPAINLGPDTSMCPGSGAITLADIINAGNTSARWLWNTGETASHISLSKPGYYYSTVTLDGCSNTDSVWVKNDCYIGIPNVFTPDGDGLNDYFFPSDLLTSGATSFKMDIYNRWGQMIFETTATNGRGWDGRFNNVPQPEGTYIYLIDVTFKNGKSEHHQGNITLLR